MTTRPAKPVQRALAPKQCSGRGGLFVFGLCGLRLYPRIGTALDRCQASSREGIDSGTLPPRIVNDRHPIAAGVVRKTDVVGWANSAHDIAFGMAERDRPRGRGGGRSACTV